MTLDDVDFDALVRQYKEYPEQYLRDIQDARNGARFTDEELADLEAKIAQQRSHEMLSAETRLGLDYLESAILELRKGYLAEDRLSQ